LGQKLEVESFARDQELSDLLFSINEGKLIKKCLLYSIKQKDDWAEFEVLRPLQAASFDPPNEFELTFLKAQENIKSDCVLTEMRLIFSMYTIQKTLELWNNFNYLLDVKLKEEQTERKIRKFQMIQTVFEHLNGRDELREEEELLKKIIQGAIVKSNLDVEKFKEDISKHLEELFLYYSEMEDDLFIERKEEELLRQSSLVDGNQKVVWENRDEKIVFSACLNKFTVWVPLDSANERS